MYVHTTSRWASRLISRCILALAVLGLSALTTAGAADFPSNIEFREDFVKILDREDVVWDNAKSVYHNFSGIQVSADGSQVLFTVACEFCDSAFGHRKRIFLANPDGSGLHDISTALYPKDIVDSWWSWGNLKINDDASRIFLNAVRETGYYDTNYWYTYSVPDQQRVEAVQNFHGTVSALINGEGSRLYFSPYATSYDPALGRTPKGLFYADTGGFQIQYMDLIDLPCTIGDCASGFSATNFISLKGTSALDDHAFFAWSHAYGASDSWEIYHARPGEAPAPLTNASHHWVKRDLEPRGICSEDGSLALYEYIHRYGEPRILSVVEVDTGIETKLTRTTDLNGWEAFMSRDGRYVLVAGSAGSEGGAHYRTLFDLHNLTQRDTHSYHLPGGLSHISNLTADNTSYFLSHADVLYRVDLQPTTTVTKAPRITRVAWTAPALLDDPEARIGIRVTVTDDTGAAGIEWVTLLPLIEGREKPDWAMGRGPLAYPTGDFSSTRLYDDGTHGDAITGDGVFSFDAIATRQEGRDDFWNTWYQHVTLPASLGIRIIAKDGDGNYGIADTQLLITETPNSESQPYHRKVRAYFHGGLGRAPTLGELETWANVLRDNNGSVWRPTGDGLQRHVSELAGWGTAIPTDVQARARVDTVLANLFGTTSRIDSRIPDYYTDQLVMGLIRERGLVNAFINDLGIMPRADGTYGKPNGWTGGPGEGLLTPAQLDAYRARVE
jgi:hypothetical protein